MSENNQISIEKPVFIEEKSFSLQKTVREFTEKNNSAETRRTYKTYLTEFFDFSNIQTANRR